MSTTNGKACPMIVGKSYALKFPRHNFCGVLSPLEQRRIKVESIRDLVAEPIERVTFDIQPLLRRGRFMVTGLDLDKNVERSFHCESMKEIVELDPKLAERKPMTAYIVGGLLVADKYMAERYAEAQAAISRFPVIIEMVTIPIDVPRSVFRIIKPLPKRKASSAKANPVKVKPATSRRKAVTV